MAEHIRILWGTAVDDLRQWMQSRRSDAVAESVLILTLVQLLVGVAIVRTASAQVPSQAVVNASMAIQQASLDVRVTRLEDMGIPARLAVIEQSQRNSDESWTEMRRIGYGLVTSIVGLIFAQIVQIRGQRKGRQ